MRSFNEGTPERRILTVPNLLSFFRLLLIPVFIWAYVGKQWSWQTGCVLALSGLTDIADGIIARRFHMISNLGKVLDPVADKMTQAAVLLCLVTRYSWMLLPLALMVCKELCMIVTGSMIIRKTGHVFGAVWHGKLATVLLYATMLLHLFWGDIPAGISVACALICSFFIILSFVLYMVQNASLLKKTSGGSQPD